jgi:hypothetical protein
MSNATYSDIVESMLRRYCWKFFVTLWCCLTDSFLQLACLLPQSPYLIPRDYQCMQFPPSQGFPPSELQASSLNESFRVHALVTHLHFPNSYTQRLHQQPQAAFKASTQLPSWPARLHHKISSWAPGKQFVSVLVI